MKKEKVVAGVEESLGMKLHTHTYIEDAYKVIITQEYYEEWNWGHYQYVIFDGLNIATVNRSYGGPQAGKADDALAKILLNYYKAVL